MPTERLANIAVAALGAGLVSAGEVATGLDTSTQASMALSLCTSMGIVVITADDAADVESDVSDQPKVDILRKEALSARKSWDARLSWAVRKRAKQSQLRGGGHT